MADVQEAQSNLLQSKWGPLPVWVWALIGLALAWAYSKYKAKTTAAAAASATDSTNTATSDGQAVAPQFIIENQLPQVTGGGAPGSTPITTPTAPTAPGTIITSPGTITMPPTTGSTAPPPESVSSSPSPAKKPTTTAPTAAKKAPIEYKVVSGDTLAAIAAKYHTSAADLWTYNTTPGVRPASTIATLKSRGEDLLYAGETILIPQ